MKSAKIRTLIIDDDSFYQEILVEKLNLYIPEIELLKTASSGTEGIESILALRPDLVFLDVEMKDMTGFEMLDKIPKVFFQTIFVTSYSHYAIDAIHYNALDYLIKPFDLRDLKNAINRFKSRLKIHSDSESIFQTNGLSKGFSNQTLNSEKLHIHCQNGKLEISLKDIIRIEGERNYSALKLTNNRNKIASKNLMEFEDMLKGKGFFRCHKSHLINQKHVISSHRNINVSLTDGSIIPIARRKKDLFIRWYQSFGKMNGSY